MTDAADERATTTVRGVTFECIDVAAADIEPGDRTSRDGKTRYEAKNPRPDGAIIWRTQTTGARSPSVVRYGPDDVVTVWRKVASERA